MVDCCLVVVGVGVVSVVVWALAGTHTHTKHSYGADLSHTCYLMVILWSYYWYAIVNYFI